MTGYWEPCFECGSLNLAFDTVDHEEGTATVICRSCGNEWEDILD